MGTDIISKGTEISTTEGYLVVKGQNCGGLVSLDEYVADESGEFALKGERTLTLSEVGHIMKDVDGKNHSVVWEED